MSPSSLFEKEKAPPHGNRQRGKQSFSDRVLQA
jgi:hypothetical protein